MQVLFILFVGIMSPFCLVQHTGEFSFLFIWALNSCHLLRECLPGNSLWDSLATMDLKVKPECGSTNWWRGANK